MTESRNGHQEERRNSGHDTPRVLCIGECMAELAPLDTAGDYRMGFAGDTFNTAWYLRQLNKAAKVSYFTAVGDDAISDRMLAFMDRAGIGTAHIARRPGRSVGMYLISLSDGERSFSYWRDISAARLLADDACALAAALGDADLVYFSGITLGILPDTARAGFLAALAKARGAGKTMVFDPNLRPRLWRDADQMTSAIMQGAEVSDIVLPSFEDETDHFGDADPAATARRYLDVGATCAVVKNGAAPVYYIDNDRTGEVAVAPAKNVVDTTSAGDSFNAGFLTTLNTDKSMSDRITLAAAVAGQVIGGKGALVTLDKTQFPNDLPAN